jgi:predicted nucleic acid-binding protein
MSNPLRLYWDTSVFLSVLNGEAGRADICKDILKNGDLGNVKILTSVWTIVEVVRPKKPGTAAMPVWAEKAIKSVEKDHPEAQQQLEMLWRRHQSDEVIPKLTSAQISKIQGMFFGWKFLTLIRVDQHIAQRAVEIQRDYNLKAGDSIHAASAESAGLDELQKWDKDFKKVAHLVNVTEPSYVSPAGPLFTTAASSLASAGAEPSSESLPPSALVPEND